MPTFTQDEITSIINGALDKMYAAEEFILKNDVSERCLVTVFRDYLLKEEKFVGYSVDVEYNLQGVNSKHMDVLLADYLRDLEPPLTDNQNKKLQKKGEFAKCITPDLIIHVRSDPESLPNDSDNLIAFEFKKSTSQQDEQFDQVKLNYLKNNFGYKFAYFIQFSTGPEFARAAIVSKKI